MNGCPATLTFQANMAQMSGILDHPCNGIFSVMKKTACLFLCRIHFFPPYRLSGSFFGHWWSMRRFDRHWEEVSWVLGRVSHTDVTDQEAGISPPHCPCGWEFPLTDFFSVALGRDVISQQRAVLRTVFITVTHPTPSLPFPKSPAQPVMSGHSISKSCCVDSWFWEWK